MISEQNSKRGGFLSWKVILLMCLIALLLVQMAGYFTAENFVSSALWTNVLFYKLAQQWLAHFIPVFATTLIVFDIVIIGLITDQFRLYKRSKVNVKPQIELKKSSESR